jgi:Tol biopolymer transport system component
VSDDSGQPEVYVRPFPGPGARTKISVDGGSSPDWSRQRSELYFRSGAGQFVSSRIALENGAVRAAAPAQLFTEAATGALLDRGWALAADGRVLVVRRAEVSHTGRITVIQHWAEEFRR